MHNLGNGGHRQPRNVQQIRTKSNLEAGVILGAVRCRKNPLWSDQRPTANRNGSVQRGPDRHLPRELPGFCGLAIDDLPETVRNAIPRDRNHIVLGLHFWSEFFHLSQALIVLTTAA